MRGSNCEWTNQPALVSEKQPRSILVWFGFASNSGDALLACPCGQSVPRWRGADQIWIDLTNDPLMDQDLPDSRFRHLD